MPTLRSNTDYLPLSQELLFQRDMQFAPGWRDWRRGFERDFGAYPNTEPGGDYNYRLAWALGATPELTEADGRYHGLSKAEMPPFRQPVDLKQEGHPTAWKQTFMETFGADPDSVESMTPEMTAFVRKHFDREIPIFTGLFSK